MIISCDNCGMEFRTIPSYYTRSKKHYCSRNCSYIGTREFRTKHINKVGVAHRYQKGHIPSPNRVLPKGEAHYAWKGNNVGYRGLHYWLERTKGKPEECIVCGSQKSIQWANIDNEYTRNPDDYIPLCSSCHKNYDLALKAPAIADA